jgi:hypothetical protein
MAGMCVQNVMKLAILSQKCYGEEVHTSQIHEDRKLIKARERTG